MAAEHIADDTGYCWCGPTLTEGGAQVVHRDGPEIAAELKATRAELDALRDAVREANAKAWESSSQVAFGRWRWDQVLAAAGLAERR